MNQLTSYGNSESNNANDVKSKTKFQKFRISVELSFNSYTFSKKPFWFQKPQKSGAPWPNVAVAPSKTVQEKAQQRKSQQNQICCYFW